MKNSLAHTPSPASYLQLHHAVDAAISDLMKVVGFSLPREIFAATHHPQFRRSRALAPP
jgi:hypothetical protein